MKKNEASNKSISELRFCVYKLTLKHCVVHAITSLQNYVEVIHMYGMLMLMTTISSRDDPDYNCYAENVGDELSGLYSYTECVADLD